MTFRGERGGLGEKKEKKPKKGRMKRRSDEVERIREKNWTKRRGEGFGERKS